MFTCGNTELLICLTIFSVASLIQGIQGEEKCIQILDNSLIQIEDVIKYKWPNSSYPVCGSYYNQINQTGWSQLDIWSNPNHQLDDSMLAFLAGYLEGFMTRELINTHFDNVWPHYCEEHKTFCNDLFAFYRQNIAFMVKKVESERESDPFWHQVGLVMEQMVGLEEGLKQSATIKPQSRHFFNQLEIGKIFILNGITDMWELESVLDRPVKSKNQGRTTCSALVKLVSHELLIGHNTWLQYGYMLRVLKKYNLSYRTGLQTVHNQSSQVVPGHTISMSSYPGLIFSLDDYYLVSSGLVVQETTNNNFNKTSFPLVKPTSVFSFIKMMVANRLAKDGQSWTKLFSQYNSGTYNNQFMIVDYNKFKVDSNPEEQIEPGLFWVFEQMPELIVAKDMTQTLVENKYWASYNIPYFEEIYKIANYPEMVRIYGPTFDHRETSRARQFKRKQAEAFDYKSLLRLLRYNNYQNDPDAQCNCSPPYSAAISIAARGDLNDPKGTYEVTALGLINEAAIDAKVTSYQLFKQFEMYAISGPTYEDVPPFIWSNSSLRDTVPHKGHPDVWVFEPVYF